jgi:aryl-alcohol dehydrogenase-like predicted oxidoreductase
MKKTKKKQEQKGNVYGFEKDLYNKAIEKGINIFDLYESYSEQYDNDFLKLVIKKGLNLDNILNSREKQIISYIKNKEVRK